MSDQRPQPEVAPGTSPGTQSPRLVQPIIRTPDQRVRVFVSSTLQELAPERVAAREAIIQLRLIPVMFEMGARPHPPRDLYRAYLDQSHIFVAIYWQRYGWVAPDMTISGLEDEFLLSGGKPTLIYIKSPSPDREPRLKDMLKRIETELDVSYKYFTTPAELKELIGNDLALLLTEGYEMSLQLARITGTLQTTDYGLRTTDDNSQEHQQRVDDEEVGELVAVSPSPPAPTSEPPIPAPETQHPTNVVLPRSHLIGRAREMEAARALLLRADVGLVTFTGAAGCGKTRLAEHLAESVLADFKDGVYFVPLAPLTDASLVLPTIAHTLNVREVGERPLLDNLKEHLEDKQLLLILDNFEQVIEAAPLISELLQSNLGFKVLATSRRPLHVREEKELPIPPLEVPENGAARSATAASISHYSAVQLFVERAQDVKPDFALTDDNAEAISEICDRLDGLPLAIELAAARIKLLPPRALQSRLTHQLPLLVGGARNLPARQQTMRGTIEWSYALLDDVEKILIRRLAVFVGSCTLDAAEAVCSQISNFKFQISNSTGPEPLNSPEIDVLEGLGSLADESLLRFDEGPEGERRFWMLEIVQEFAQECLSKSNEEGAIRSQHADYYLALAEEAEPELRRSRQVEWSDRLEREHGNLRAALEWCKGAPERAVTALRIVGALWRFWWRRGFLTEGRQRIADALASPGASQRTSERAKALYGAAYLAYLQGDYGAMRTPLADSLAIARELDDKENLATYLMGQGQFSYNQAEYTVARTAIEEGLAIRRELGDEWGLATALNNLGLVTASQGDYIAAKVSLEESLALSRAHEDQWGIAAALNNLALITRGQGDFARAEVLGKESLTVRRTMGDNWGIAFSLAGLASAANGLGQSERAARLFGATDAILESLGAHLEPVYQTEYDRNIAAIKSALTPAAFDTAQREGRAMNVNAAINYALEKE